MESGFADDDTLGELDKVSTAAAACVWVGVPGRIGVAGELVSTHGHVRTKVVFQIRGGDDVVDTAVEQLLVRLGWLLDLGKVDSFL